MQMRLYAFVLLVSIAHPLPTSAEVTGVTITSRAANRYLLAEDLDLIVERAKSHWSFATREERR